MSVFTLLSMFIKTNKKSKSNASKVNANENLIVVISKIISI